MFRGLSQQKKADGSDGGADAAAKKSERPIEKASTNAATPSAPEKAPPAMEAPPRQDLPEVTTAPLIFVSFLRRCQPTATPRLTPQSAPQGGFVLKPVATALLREYSAARNQDVVLNVMVVGESGLGKTTTLRTLFGINIPKLTPIQGVPRGRA
jgi:hypothetical protein